MLIFIGVSDIKRNSESEVIVEDAIEEAKVEVYETKVTI